MTVTAFLESGRTEVLAGLPRTPASTGGSWPEPVRSQGRPSTRRRDALLKTPEGQALHANAMSDLGAAFEAHGLSPMAALRMKKGWSQKALCDASGLPQPHLSRLENGKVPSPDLSTLNKLAQALGVPLAQVLTAVEQGAKRT